MSRDPAEPTRTAMDTLLTCLPDFENPSFESGSWHQPCERGQESTTLPSYQFDEILESFVSACHKHGWITSAAWPAWQKSAERLMGDKTALAVADAQTIRKLITFHIRKERFREGHLAAMFQVGHIVSLLRRLAEIRQTMDLRP